MKKFCIALALAGSFLVSKSSAISLDDIQIWTGSGTNRAALVIEWNAPIAFNNSSVPAPIANKTMAWGYRFNGSATATQMLGAIVASDPKLYFVADDTYGTFVEGIGYNLTGNGLIGITDGTATNYITNGLFTGATVDMDAAHAVNGGDLYWGGYFGPNWNLWTELGDAGGFTNSPNRGTSQYYDPNTYNHGEWSFADYGTDDLMLTNGSWIGFSVAGAGYDSNTNDAATAIYNLDEQAPPSPDGTYTAYVCNTNDFAAQLISSTNIYTSSPYNDPNAVLNRPTLLFYDPYDGSVTDRVSIIDDPYNVAPDGTKLLTEIKAGGQITVSLGRRIYDDPNNPYGVDFIVYGNSLFYGLSGVTGGISDSTDLNAATFSSSAIFGHAALVSVSQDGSNWFTYGTNSVLFPDNAYRWDDANDSWTFEQMNPNKPLNPTVAAMNFNGQTVAGALDQFVGASGGSGYDLAASGFPWIQYIRVQPAPGVATVIDAIAAVNPVVVGDALSITSDNISNGLTNLVFQSPSQPTTTLVSIHFGSLSNASIARVSTVSLSEFSAFAPVPGSVSSAYQVTLKPLSGTNTPSYLTQVGLQTGAEYSGNGSDLRVYQWIGTNWNSRPFTYNPANGQVTVSGVTNFSAFVVSQIVQPRLQIKTISNGFAFQFTAVPNCANILERTTDLATWTPIATNTPTSAVSITLQDTNAPAGKAFYRLLLNIP